MEARSVSFEVKVGIFVFLGIIIMFLIVFSIGEFYILKPTYKIRVTFGFANGIEDGAPVRLAGINVGEIEDVGAYYDDLQKRTKVFMVAKIKKQARVERDAVCRINTLGLLGEKYLEITPGTAASGHVQDQETVIGEDPVPMEEVTKTMKELTDTARAITASTKVIMERLEKGDGTIGKLLAEEEIYDNLRATTENLRELSEDVKHHPWKLLIKGRETEKTKDPGKEAPGGIKKGGVNFKK
ncbi:MAG: MCE family protein [Candidatus Omnitrophica bacterium]|nr:MCE family protein [Candidatus Omnitrophota bacterium]